MPSLQRVENRFFLKCRRVFVDWLCHVVDWMSVLDPDVNMCRGLCGESYTSISGVAVTLGLPMA